jgi:hypothetical protein
MPISSLGIKRLRIRSHLGWLMVWRTVSPRSQEVAMAQARGADFVTGWNERCWAAIEYHRIGYDRSVHTEPVNGVETRPQ